MIDLNTKNNAVLENNKYNTYYNMSTIRTLENLNAIKYLYYITYHKHISLSLSQQSMFWYLQCKLFSGIYTRYNPKVPGSIRSKKVNASGLKSQKATCLNKS